jgi:hypothetical protein
MHIKVTKSSTLVSPSRAVFVTPYIANDDCGLYPAMEEIRITDEPFVK